jgi:hypothetical protein
MIHPAGVLQCLADTKSAVCAALSSAHVLAAWKVLSCDSASCPFTFHYFLATQPIYL